MFHMAESGHTALPLRPVGLLLFRIMAGTYVHHVNITCAFARASVGVLSVLRRCILNLIVSQHTPVVLTVWRQTNFKFLSFHFHLDHHFRILFAANWLGPSWPRLLCRYHSHYLVAKFLEESTLERLCHEVSDHVSRRTPCH